MMNILTLLALPLFAAPAAASAVPATAPAPVDSASVSYVVVENDRNVPVTVYAQNDYGEYRLGVVAPGATQTLGFGNYVVDRGEVKFFVQPKGQLEEVSTPVDVERGQHIGLIVPARKQ